jgi:outer membrane receptor protein involved in Fe transport
MGCRTIAANGTYAAVNDAESKGHELEINYNPTKYWTVSASVTKTQSINTAAGAAVDDYIAARMPVWTTLEDPRYTQTTADHQWCHHPDQRHQHPDRSHGPPALVEHPGNDLQQRAHGGRLQRHQLGGDEFRRQRQCPDGRVPRPDRPPAAADPRVLGQAQHPVQSGWLQRQQDHQGHERGWFVRYASKGSIGFYGLGYTENMDLTLPANRILALDPNRPIYSPAETYVDMFVTYSTKLFNDKVRARFQLNVKNLQENGGGLQATGAFFDGKAQTYRIVDPRQFVLSASFDL